ncbi:hypothetical protein BGZ73_008977 [Actinomortierella ambigua]|nr:hypothetical protein BGZ73_008977 [Actinomortierella ambigua]
MAKKLLYGSRSKKRCLLWTASIISLWLFVPSHLVWTDYFSGPAVYSQILNRLEQPVCPTLKPYDRQKLLLLEPIDCTSIESQHPDFSADICFSPYVCNEGLVRIRRRDRILCNAAETKTSISSNATHDAFHRQFSGPDSFYVVFSGAEKLAPPDWYHAGHCLYVFPFHISNPGRLSLEITHLYDNYGAVLEKPNQWPEFRLQKVVEAFPLEICRGCPSRTAAPRSMRSTAFATEKSSRLGDGKMAAAGGSSVFSRFGSKNIRRDREVYKDPRDRFVKRDDNDDSAPLLPLCSRQFSVQGAWLPAHPEDKSSWRKANYTWTPLGCRYDRPLTRSCLSRRGTKTKKISFQGDPQLRVLLEHLLRRLNGTAQIQTSTASSLDSLETKIEATSISYLLDPLMTRRIAPADFLVTNLGQWATGTKYLDQQMATEKYHNMLLDLIDDFRQTTRDSEDLEDEDIEDLLDEGGDEADEDANYATDELEDWQPLRVIDAIASENSEVNDNQADEDGDGVESKDHSPSQDVDETDDGDDSDGFDEVDGSLVEEEDASHHGRSRLIHQRVSKSAAKFSPVTGDSKSGELILQDEKNGHRPSVDKSQKKQSPQQSPSGKPERPRSRSPQHGSEDSPPQTSPMAPNQSRSSGQRSSSSLSSPSSPSDASLPTSGSMEMSRIRLGKRFTGKKSGDSSNGSKQIEPQTERTATKLVWAGMVAYPETQPVDRLIVHDWRSIYRLRYWNQIAEEVMILNGVPFMDLFPMTLSMVDTSPDRSHYYGTDAIEAMLEELQSKLGLCADDGGF